MQIEVILEATDAFQPYIFAVSYEHYGQHALTFSPLLEVEHGCQTRLPFLSSVTSHTPNLHLQPLSSSSAD